MNTIPATISTDCLNPTTVRFKSTGRYSTVEMRGHVGTAVAQTAIADAVDMDCATCGKIHNTFAHYLEIVPPAELSAGGYGIELMCSSGHAGYVIELYRSTEPDKRQAGDTYLWFERKVGSDTAATYARHIPDGSAGDVVKMLNRARKVIDGWHADEVIYPSLVKALADNEAAEWAPSDETVAVGDVVGVFSRGQWRPAVIEKMHRTGSATVAYVTRGGLESAQKYNGEAQITRKTVAVTALRAGRPEPMPDHNRTRSDIARDRANCAGQIRNTRRSLESLAAGETALTIDEIDLMASLVTNLRLLMCRVNELDIESKAALQAQVDEDWPGAIVYDDGMIGFDR